MLNYSVVVSEGENIPPHYTRQWEKLFYDIAYTFFKIFFIRLIFLDTTDWFTPNISEISFWLSPSIM